MKNSFFKNTFWILFGKTVQMIISLIIGMFTARYLGPDNFGEINYVISYIAFFSSLCTLGLNGIIIKELVSNPDREGEYIGTAIIMRLSVSLISIILFISLMIIMHSDNNSLIMIALLMSISLFFQSFDIINYWYQFKLQSKVAVFISLFAYIVVAFYKIYILINNKSIEWFAFVTSLDVMIIAILLIPSYYIKKGEKLKFSYETAKNLLSQSHHFIISGLLIVIYAQTDKIMIGQWLTVNDVGLYSAAIAICGFWSFIPIAIIDSSRTIIMKQKNINQYVYVKRVKQLYCTLIWLSIFYGIFVTIFAEYIIAILYGTDYIAASTCLRLAVWYCGFSFLGAAKNIWLICENKQKFEKWFTFLGAISNIILNVIMIPKWGINGAAMATLITQILTNFIYPMIFKDTRDSSKYIIEAFYFNGILGNVKDI